MGTNDYTTKEILNNFIENDFRDMKNKVEIVTAQMTNFVTKQLVINEQIMNFKTNYEEEKKECKNKKQISLVQRITVSIAICNGLLAVFLAFFR